tara:strand:- start:153 stop:1049 length:897 start_codon:yes stop_codon:yes gene_type:complete
MAKTIRGGYLHKFDDDFHELVDKKVSFNVISSGLTRKILLPIKDDTPHKRLYFGHKKDDILPGVHMVNAVRRNVDSYIEAGGETPKIIYKPKLILYNFMQIEKALMKDPVDLTFAIDINACFFRTAFNLGYITEELYNKGWEKRKKNKLGLLASIGSLNKHETIQEYKNGKLKKQYLNWEYKNRYSGFYWSVINYVAKVMMEIATALDEKFYMWLTDCIYIDKKYKHIVEEILDKHGYDYKDFYIEFEDLTPKEVKWFDFKSNQKKYINHNILLNYQKGYNPFIDLSKYEKYGGSHDL